MESLEPKINLRSENMLFCS